MIENALPLKDNPLDSNFTLFFECELCNYGYQVELTEVFVNTGGTYSSRFITQVNQGFRQTYMQLIPIVINYINDPFDVSKSLK